MTAGLGVSILVFLHGLAINVFNSSFCSVPYKQGFCNNRAQRTFDLLLPKTFPLAGNSLRLTTVLVRLRRRKSNHLAADSLSGSVDMPRKGITVYSYVSVDSYEVEITGPQSMVRNTAADNFIAKNLEMES